MYIETPLVRSLYFPQDVYLKLENTQPSGSFKSRGITHLIREKAQSNRNCVVYSSSGGNAGLAAAEAAKEFNLPCLVVVPTTTKPRMVKRIEKQGAQVKVEGSMFKEADQHLRQIMAQSTGQTPIYCHAFDNELIWEGHSSIVDEICQKITPGAIVLSCGGGGLYTGVMMGLERLQLASKVPVVVVETPGAASFHDSVVARKQVVLDKIDTCATSLGSVYVPQRAIDYALKYNTKSVLVSDEDAVKAVKQFANDHCMIVEPACAVTLAAIHKGHTSEFEGPIVAIVCGGTSWSVDDVLS